MGVGLPNVGSLKVARMKSSTIWQASGSKVLRESMSQLRSREERMSTLSVWADMVSMLIVGATLLVVVVLMGVILVMLFIGAGAVL